MNFATQIHRLRLLVKSSLSFEVPGCALEISIHASLYFTKLVLLNPVWRVAAISYFEQHG